MNIQTYINNIDETNDEKHLLFSWEKQDLDLSSIQNNKALRILIDKSGSMNSIIDYHKLISRSQVVAESIIYCSEFLNKLFHDGIHIYVGLFLFNNTCTCVLNYVLIDDTILEYIRKNVSQWTIPNGGTDFGEAFEKSHKLMSTYCSNNYETILISDGYNNGKYSDDVLIQKFGNTIDMCIGIGSVNSYNDTLFKLLTIHKNVYGAKDASELKEYFVNSVFGITTKVAEDIKIIIPKNIILTSPIDYIYRDNNIIINIDNFHSHRIFMLSTKHSYDFKITVTYKLVKTGEYKMKYFFTNDAIVDDNISEKIKLYCKYSQKFRKSGLNQIKIKNMYETLDKLDQKDNVIDSNIIALKNELKKLIEIDDANEYESLLHQTTLQTSTMNYSIHSLHQTQNYVSLNDIGNNNTNSIRGKDDLKERLLCLVCYNYERETIFRPCKHFAACINCTKQYVKDNKKCPICRSKINNLYEVKTPSLKTIDKFKCVDCKNNRINCIVTNCNHICLCTKCAYKRIKNKDTCPICNQFIFKNIDFIMS